MLPKNKLRVNVLDRSLKASLMQASKPGNHKYGATFENLENVIEFFCQINVFSIQSFLQNPFK